jgi:hypothetical protein
LQKQKKGQQQAFIILRLLVIFSLDLNHCANQKATLMMDGLDPLLSKNNGRNSLIATLFAKRKTCHHFTQALDVLRHLRCGGLKFHCHKSDSGAMLIAMIMGSILLFCFATLNPILS